MNKILLNKIIVFFVLFIFAVYSEAAVLINGVIKNDNASDFVIPFTEKLEINPVSDNNSKTTEAKFSNISNGYLQAKYSRCNTDMVNAIIEKYKTIPGGVTLEGMALGLPAAISSVRFNPENNSLIFNNNIVFETGLNEHTVKSIFNAIETSDLIGVSLGDKDLVYGNIEKTSFPGIFMKMLDHYLGSIVFASGGWLRFQKLPGGFVPERDNRTGNYAVYFNFSDFKFKTEGEKITTDSAGINITLIPLTEVKDKNGGYVPDYTRISKGEISNSFESNISHVVKNIAYFQNDARMKNVISYGRVAAIARVLKANNINLTKVL